MVCDYYCDIPHGVFTNLLGPTIPISFAEQAVIESRRFPPQVGKGSIGVALVSYNGKVSIGAITDVTIPCTSMSKRVLSVHCKKLSQSDAPLK